MLTKANIRNIKKVREFIASLSPKHLVMNVFARHGNNHAHLNTAKGRKHFREVGCGTAGCLAGWGAVALGIFGKSMERDIFSPTTFTFSPSIISEKLGISGSFYYSIFTGHWPTIIMKKHNLPALNDGALDLIAFDALPGQQRKAAMLDVLDYLLLTGQDVSEVEQANATNPRVVI